VSSQKGNLQSNLEEGSHVKRWDPIGYPDWAESNPSQYGGQTLRELDFIIFELMAL
jgi:hypothetical protein